MKLLKTLILCAALCLVLSLCLGFTYRSTPGCDAAVQASEAILRGVEQRQAEIDVSACGLTGDELWNVYIETVYTLHPELIYTTGFNYTVTDGTVTTVRPYYDYRVTPERIAEYEERIGFILSGIDPALSDLEKVIVLHERFCMEGEYDLDSPESHDLVCNGVGVCRAYARALCDCLRRLGIEARYVSSREMNHAWNLVKLGGHWYHIDATFDDSVYCCGSVSHNWFLKSDAAISRDHSGWALTSFLTGEYLFADDTSFDQGMPWEDARQSVVVAAPGVWYTLRAVPGAAENLRLVEWRSGFEREVCAISARWPADVSVNYSSLRSALFLLDGRLFFNDANCIYAFDPAAGRTETVYTDPYGRCYCGMALRQSAQEDYLNIELSNPGGEGRCIWLTSVGNLALTA